MRRLDMWSGLCAITLARLNQAVFRPKSKAEVSPSMTLRNIPREGTSAMTATTKRLAQQAATLAFTLLLALTSVYGHATPKIFFANYYGAKGDGTTLDIDALHKANEAAASSKPRTYLTGSLFLNSGITFEVPDGVTLIGSQNIKDFPDLPTRIAGVEMTWPAAMINLRDQHDITITGKGTIDGNGAVWWKVFRDTFTVYQPKGLRRR